jgi:hypothetical protein
MITGHVRSKWGSPTCIPTHPLTFGCLLFALHTQLSAIRSGKNDTYKCYHWIAIQLHHIYPNFSVPRFVPSLGPGSWVEDNFCTERFKSGCVRRWKVRTDHAVVLNYFSKLPLLHFDSTSQTKWSGSTLECTVPGLTIQMWRLSPSPVGRS